MLPHVDAISAVSSATLASLRTRNLLRVDVPVEIIPIGAERRDHAVAAEWGRNLIVREEGTFHVAYLGTLTSRMLPALSVFLHAVSQARSTASRRIALHLIGTSAQAGGNDQHDLRSLAAQSGVIADLHLHPARVSYLDALRTMQEADLLLLVGSTDSHYTASKLFPYWLTGKPILGLFHRQSTIVGLAEELGGTRLIVYNESEPPETRVGELSALLAESVEGKTIVPPRNEQAFESYSADGVASRYARLFSKVAAGCE